MTWHRPPLTDEELRLIRIRDRDKTDALAVIDRRDLLAEVERLRAEKAEAWDEGHAVATDDFLHSDYCGRRCQCSGLAGTRNPYKDAS